MLGNQQRLPHRRVMNSGVTPLLSANPEVYNDSPHINSLLEHRLKKHVQTHKNRLGLQRVKLAQYVMSQMDKQHTRSTDILQKFRRQVQEAKQRKLKGALRFNPLHENIISERIPSTFGQLKDRVFEKKSISQFQKPKSLPLRQFQIMQNCIQLTEHISPQPTHIHILFRKQSPRRKSLEPKLTKQNNKLERKIKSKDKALIIAVKQLRKVTKKLLQVQDEVEQQKNRNNVRSGQVTRIEQMIKQISSKVNQNGIFLSNSVMHSRRQKQDEQKQQNNENGRKIRNRNIKWHSDYKESRYIPTVLQTINGGKLPLVRYTQSKTDPIYRAKENHERDKDFVHHGSANNLCNSEVYRMQKIYEDLDKLRESHNRLETYQMINYF